MAAPRTPGGARANAAILGQVGFIIAIPVGIGAWLGLQIDRAAGTSPIALLGLIFLGMVIAGVGVAMLIRRYAEENPIGPVTERAREAGRRWEAEIREREAQREVGDDEPK